APPSRRALSQIETTSPKATATWPAAIDPATNAADPAPRTRPYSNPPAVASDADSAKASAIGAIGACKADCIRLTARIAPKPPVGRYTRAIAPAPAAQTDKVPRHLLRRSASRPTSGPNTSRTAVPNPITTAICCVVRPRSSKYAGRNGETTPNAP